MKTLSTVLCLAILASAAATLGSAATGNSLAAGKSINYNETLVSTDGGFSLGFFGARANRSYLGMWYNRIPVRTVVWVANRQRPLPASSGSLTLLPNGSLVLTDGASTTYWSTGIAAAWRNPVARLLDDGNLVVLEDGSDVYYWQSFDHPTDTLLPGMRLGFNNRTGESYALTAWKAADDPGPGDNSWVLTSRGVPQALALNRTAPLWRGGPWVGGRFSGVPEMKDSNLFTYAYINSPNGTYFQFNVWDKSIVTRITVNPSGVAQHLQWNDGRRTWTALWTAANDTCDRLDACGINALCVSTRSPVCECLEGFRSNQPTGDAGAAATCNREKPLSCPRGGKDNFVLVSGAKLPDTTIATVDKGLGVEECRAACLQNCSCTAFTSSDGSGCITWFDDLNDVRTYTNSGQDLYVRVASEGRKDQKKVVITIVVLVTFIVIMVPTLICLCRRRIRMRLQASRQLVEEGHHEEGDQGTDFGLPLFHFSTLQQATDHFSFRNKLGEGGYGPVYMGMLHHPQQSIAIKRLSKDSTQGLEQFKCEVQLVAKLQHRNLVRLLGCCIENDEKILIYEYMVNQSLDKVIFDASKGQELDWAKRLRIIEGISQGLLYLHKYSRLTVIHRDLKASNILLDGDWTPKISDFGLARIFNWNEPQANTKRIIGTYGYMPPEYAMKGLFSIKSDVYSFGVLLLEILTGKKSTSISDFGISQNLPGRAWELWRQGKALEMVDPAMGSSVPGGEFSKCVHVALLCVQENPADRPTMVDVVAMLNSDTAAGMPTPSQPAFFLVRHATTVDGSGSEIEHFSSSNSVTMTRVEGR